MDSKSLTPDQIAKLLKTTRRMSRWLECFTGRMHQRHFPHTDPVKLVGEDALKAVAPLRDGISI